MEEVAELVVVYGVIYKCTNLINGKVYIGQTTRSLRKRRDNHIDRARNKSTSHFHRSMNKYGFENFKWEIIDSASSKEELDFKESLHIKLFNTQQNGYNIADGGFTAGAHKQETKDKISKTMKGRPCKNAEFLHSKEAIRKGALSRSGIKSSQAKKVMCEETGDVFELISWASKQYKISISGISCCLHGRQKTAGGFHWSFVK